jgi:hypothetical protein
MAIRISPATGIAALQVRAEFLKYEVETYQEVVSL